MAEQQWTAAKSFNDHLNLEKLTAVKNLQEAKKYKPIAEKKMEEYRRDARNTPACGPPH